MKIDLTKREVDVINRILSMVQVNLDEAADMLILREKFKTIQGKKDEKQS